MGERVWGLRVQDDVASLFGISHVPLTVSAAASRIRPSFVQAVDIEEGFSERCGPRTIKECKDCTGAPLKPYTDAAEKFSCKI